MSTTATQPPVLPLQRVLPALLLLATLLALFYDTVAAMVGIWMRSDTYAHATLVPPIALWLVWRRRAHLAQLQPRAVPWMLLPVAAACLLWLLGELAGVNSATQFAVVALVVLLVPAVFGFAVSREILFPLMFLFFAVPIGEFLVPYMMEWTADFTVAALTLSGVPVYREGLQFVIPSGNWSVVEACSGVRYLIATFMVGSLFAYLNYQSNKRRAIFILASIGLAIVANWLRAYMIVMLGHLSGNKLAVGADHLVYGWVFFGVIILVMFMVGARWSEPDKPAPATLSMQAATAARSGSQTWIVTVGVLGLLLATQALIWRLDRPSGNGAPVLALPAVLPGDWVSGGAPLADWKPDYQRPSVVAQNVYRSGDKAVAVWVAYYRDQNYERKLVTSTNLLVTHDSVDWAVSGSGSAALSTGLAASRVRTLSLRQPANPNLEARVKLDAAYVYWVGGRYTTSDAEAKLMLAFNRLLGRGDDGAVLFFYTAQRDAGQSAQVLRDFIGLQLGPLGEMLGATEAARASR